MAQPLDGADQALKDFRHCWRCISVAWPAHDRWAVLANLARDLRQHRWKAVARVEWAAQAVALAHRIIWPLVLAADQHEGVLMHGLFVHALGFGAVAQPIAQRTKARGFV